MDDQIFLNGNFQQYPACDKPYSVRLGRRNIIFEETLDTTTYTKLAKGFTSILLNDVVAARLFNSRISNDKSAYFQIISYPLTNINKKKCKRRKRVITFRVNESDDGESNMLVAETWARTIEWLLKDPEISQEDLQDIERFPKKKRILVLINPRSGNGASLSKFRKFVEPVFKDAGISYQELVTKSAHQATEIAYDLNLEEWDGIAICSGDGLAFEVVQGLMQRTDWETAIKMPIGMIPTGSGNALCASVLHAAKDMFDIVSAAFQVVRGKPHPIDLCSMQNDNRRLFSFLSLTWGIIADIDIESERFRMLGNARFTVGAMTRVIALRLYGGRLSFLPIPDEERTELKTEACDMKDTASEKSTDIVETPFLAATPASGASISGDSGAYSKLEEDVRYDGAEENYGTQTEARDHSFDTRDVRPKSQEVFSKRGSLNSSTTKYAQVENDFENASPIEEESQRNPAKQKRGFSTNDIGKYSTMVNRPSQSEEEPSNSRPVLGPEDSLLPSMEEALSGDWVSVDGEFVTVLVMMISHLGSDLLSCPGLGLGDGVMWLLFIKRGISKKSLVDILTKMESGEHVKNRDLEIRQIRAFRLEPKFERTGYIAVDGELVNYERIQGQIHKGLGRVLLAS